jgi:tetratricopeptide (TPR) repeat protein
LSSLFPTLFDIRSEAIERHPTSAAVLLVKADFHKDVGECEASKRALQAAAALDVRNAEPHVALALLAEGAGDVAAAAEAFENAVAADDTSLSALNSSAVFKLKRAAALRDGGEADAQVAELVAEAEFRLRKAASLRPNDVSTLTNLAAFLLEFDGDVDAAERLLKRALAEEGGYYPALMNYAFLLANERAEYDRACTRPANFLTPPPSCNRAARRCGGADEGGPPLPCGGNPRCGRRRLFGRCRRPF